MISLSAGASLKNAPQLKKQTASLSLLLDIQGNPQFVGGLPLFLVDEDGQLVSALQGWLDTLDRQMGATGDSLLPPLLISGLTKVSNHLSFAHYIVPFSLLVVCKWWMSLLACFGLVGLLACVRTVLA